MEDKEIGQCVMCDKTYTHFGNNPDPISTIGRCCDDCNSEVISTRLKQVGIDIKPEALKELDKEAEALKETNRGEKIDEKTLEKLKEEDADFCHCGKELTETEKDELGDICQECR